MTIEFEPVIVIVSRDEVEAGDTSSVVQLLKSCVASQERALSLFEKLDVAFHGYNQDSREVFEIPEVRNFVSILDSEFPFWLFFLTKRSLGLRAIMLCFMPPFLNDEARQTLLPRRLDDLLSGRWFPAMNHICEAVGFSEDQIEALTNRVVDYFSEGPCAGAT